MWSNGTSAARGVVTLHISYTHAYLKMCVKRVLNIKYAFIRIRICRSLGMYEVSLDCKGQSQKEKVKLKGNVFSQGL